MIGDTGDYIKLVSLVKGGKPLEIPLSELILGAKKEGKDDAADLDDDAKSVPVTTSQKEWSLDALKWKVANLSVKSNPK